MGEIAWAYGAIKVPPHNTFFLGTINKSIFRNLAATDPDKSNKFTTENLIELRFNFEQK